MDAKSVSPITSDASDPLAAALQRLRKWYRRFVVWRIAGLAMTTVIAGGSAVVASKLIQGLPSDILALVIATCASMQAAISPQIKSNAYRLAWITLDLAVKEAEGLSPALVAAIRQGEAEIDGTHGGPSTLSPDKAGI